MKVEGHEILDFWFNGLQMRLIFDSLSDSYDGWLKVGLHSVSA
jgi:hypothetical protein